MSLSEPLLILSPSSYDADEATQTSAPSAPAPAPAPAAPEPAPPPMTTNSAQPEPTQAPLHTPSIDNYGGVSTETNAYGHHSNAGYQNGSSAMHGDAGSMTHVHSEPQGTGIKEDG